MLSRPLLRPHQLVFWKTPLSNTLLIFTYRSLNNPMAWLIIYRRKVCQIAAIKTSERDCAPRICFFISLTLAFLLDPVLSLISPFFTLQSVVLPVPFLTLSPLILHNVVLPVPVLKAVPLIFAMVFDPSFNCSFLYSNLTWYPPFLWKSGIERILKKHQTEQSTTQTGEDCYVMCRISSLILLKTSYQMFFIDLPKEKRKLSGTSFFSLSQGKCVLLQFLPQRRADFFHWTLRRYDLGPLRVFICSIISFLSFCVFKLLVNTSYHSSQIYNQPMFLYIH